MEEYPALGEAFALPWQVHACLEKRLSDPIHSDLLKSVAVVEVYCKHDSHLLPIVCPESSPAHPAYPAGHTAISGACVKGLKVLFRESYDIQLMSNHLDLDGAR